MTFQSTVASIQNIRKQKQLELELIELDRKWHVELKIIARERLGLVKELCRINRNQRELDHFKASLHGKDITRFADKAQGRLQHVKEDKKVHKYNFEPDPVEKMNIQYPLVHDDMDDFPGEGQKHNGHRRRVSGTTGFQSEGGDIGKVLTTMDLKKHRVQLMKSNYDQCTADRRNRRRPFWDKSIVGSKKKHERRDRNGFFRGGPSSGGGGSGSGSLFSALQYANGSDGSSSGNGGGYGAGISNVWGIGLDGEEEEILPAAEGEFEERQHHYENGEEEEGREGGRRGGGGRGGGREDREEDEGEENRRVNGHERRRRTKREEDEEENHSRFPKLTKATRIKSPSLPSLQSLRRVHEGMPAPRPPKSVHPSLSDRRSASMDYLPVIKGQNNLTAAKGHNKGMNGSHKPAAKNSSALSPSTLSSTHTTLPTISET